MRFSNIKGQSPRGVKAFAYRALHVIVPVVLIAFVVRSVGAGDVLARLSGAHPGWVLASLVACSAQMVLCSYRWRLTAARLGTDIRPRAAISEYYLSSLVNSTVPGGVLGDALRAVRTKGAAGLERAAQSVIIERLAGQIALGAALLLGLFLSGQPALQNIALIASIALVVTLLLLTLMRGPLRARVLPGIVRRFLSAMRVSWLHRSAAAPQVILSVLIVAANLAAFAFAARATGAVMGFPDVLYAVPLILAAMLIPFSVAGWGYREGAAAAVFPLIGASAAAGVSASVVFGAVILVASLPGLIVVFSRSAEVDDAQHDAAEARYDPAE
ncbi:MAG: lysylphosphatidylglycerol synthase transmembrane domain-containing protein [Pseudomonadota bacterium]